MIDWSGRADLNCRPLAPQANLDQITPQGRQSRAYADFTPDRNSKARVQSAQWHLLPSVVPPRDKLHRVRSLFLFGLFLFLCYVISQWLFFGPGQGVLLLGSFCLFIYLVFGEIPKRMSRPDYSQWQASRDWQLILFVGITFCLGAYWIPKRLNLAMSWYWKILFGIAVAWFGLVTRR